MGLFDLFKKKDKNNEKKELDVITEVKNKIKELGSNEIPDDASIKKAYDEVMSKINFYLSILQLMSYTIAGPIAELISGHANKKACQLKEKIIKDAKNFVPKKILKSIKDDIKNLAPPINNKGVIVLPFYNYPPTIFHMIRYIYMHKFLEQGLGGPILLPNGLLKPTAKFQKAWDLNYSKNLYSRALSFLEKYDGDFKNFNKCFKKETGKLAKSEYLLKYYAFIAVELAVLGGGPTEAKKIDDKFAELSKKDEHFKNYFRYVFFILKVLATLRLMSPAVLDVDEEAFIKEKLSKST